MFINQTIIKKNSACFDLSLTCLSLVYDVGKLQRTCMIKPMLWVLFIKARQF